MLIPTTGFMDFIVARGGTIIEGAGLKIDGRDGGERGLAFSVSPNLTTGILCCDTGGGEGGCGNEGKTGLAG